MTERDNGTPSPSSHVMSIPAGWKLVPIEPTEAMLAEACSSAPHVIITYTKPEERDGSVPLIPLATWRAMIAAVPDDTVSEGFALVPVKMTAAMINAWSGGKTVTTDEIAFNTSFQKAWARVLSAAIAPASDYPSPSQGKVGPR